MFKPFTFKQETYGEYLKRLEREEIERINKQRIAQGLEPLKAKSGPIFIGEAIVKAEIEEEL